MLVALTNVRLRVRSGHHKITPQCPLLALSGHQLASALQMSAIGGKADIRHWLALARREREHASDPQKQNAFEPPRPWLVVSQQGFVAAGWQEPLPL